MAMTLEELWKVAKDEDVLRAIGRWESTNEAAQRVIAAEVKRRGLHVTVPEIVVRSAPVASTAASPLSAKAMVAMVATLAAVAAVAALVE